MMIAVIGGEVSTESDADRAYEAGREIARRGHVLLCGGRGGIMAAACRGAREAGGHTIGILPGDDRSDANEWLEFAIPTGLGHARNTIIATAADAVIAIGGRYGTLSEIAFAMIRDKPVAALGSWELIMPGGEAAPIVPADSPSEALDYFEALAAEKGT
jgi:uncharacterized protein (TIGR00725 family)